MLQRAISLPQKLGVIEPPLVFMQRSMLALSKISSSRELDSYLDCVFEQDWRVFVDQHSKMLLVFSMILSAEVRRIVFRAPSIVFPNKLLLLPPLYHQLGWVHPENSEWDQLHRQAVAYFAAKPNVSDAVLLLYLEGMKYTLLHAVFLYEQRLLSLRTSGAEYIAAANLVEELRHHGWPMPSEQKIAQIH